MTQCERSGMKSINVKMLLGHGIGVSGHYYRPAESDILEDYMTHAAADALTIDPTQRLQQENQDLKTTQDREIAEQSQMLALQECRSTIIFECGVQVLTLILSLLMGGFV